MQAKSNGERCYGQWIEAHLITAGGTYLLAVDEVVVSKAGKMTHGVGRFYSSIAGRPIGGLSFVAAALVDVGQRRSYPVQVEQRLPTPKVAKVASESVKRGRGRPQGSKNHAKSAPLLNAELSVLDGLLGSLLKRPGGLQVRHLVMDGFFGNYATTWLAPQHGLHLIKQAASQRCLVLVLQRLQTTSRSDPALRRAARLRCA